MKKTTISRKLLKLNTGILLISLLSIVLTVIYLVWSSSENQFISLGSNMLTYSSSRLSQVFDDSEQALSTIEESYSNRTDEESLTPNIFNSIQQSTALYQHTYIVFNNGDYFITPRDKNIPADFDPRTRTWYQEATSHFGDYVWSTPYVDVGTGELVITCSKAFRDPLKNETVVIGLDVTIENLREMMATLSSLNAGETMLVNQNDTIILHSDDSRINQQLQTYDDRLLIAEFHAQTPVYRTSTGIFMQRTLPRQEMYLVRYLSYAQFIKRIVPFTFTLLLLMSFFLLLGSLASFNLSKRITTPILELKESILTQNKEELLKTCDIQTNDEINELIEGYNFLIQDVNEKTLEMIALYEQLTASEETLQEQYDQLYKNQQTIKSAHEKYELISDALTQGLMELRHNNDVILHSKKWFNQFDLPKKHIELSHWTKLIHPEDVNYFNEQLMDHFNKKTAIFSLEYKVKNISEDYLWIASSGQGIFGANGALEQLLMSHNDISNRKNSENKMLTMAYTDGLTGLLNRSRLKEVVTDSINNKEQGTMFYIDLDNFKFLNDNYGHSYGDRVLIELSHRLMEFRDVECDIARISGDEFAIVIKDTLSLSKIENLAKTILDKISKKMTLDEIELGVTASIGIASYPYDAESFEDLLVNADISMHHAKNESKNHFIIFTEAIKNDMLSAMNMERHLNNALLHDEISIHYQPVVRIHTGEIVGFEALVRWNSPTFGTVPPDVFIPIAEKNKYIVPLGDYIMRNALQFIIELNKEFGTSYEIALNISAIQLEEAGFCDKVFDLLELHGYSAKRLNLEITESISLDSNPLIIENLNILYNKGIPISLDDFGTGYSTFSNLTELPLNHLKIDKGIVQRSVTDDHVFKLIDSIVEFAHRMGIKVIAEGIEDKVMNDRMEDIDVDFAQGYMYSKPVDGITLRKLVEKKRL